jgi:eukaryotic-like serine/threonine-protein kinase
MSGSASALSADLAEWAGTSRYRVRRCIGTGSVGAVYEAFDAERDIVVAVKRLRHFSPLGLYNFKQEFRTLADVHHPNLVRLYELVANEERDVFFTMELVRGVDIVTHVREGGEPDFGRARETLRQLTEGVQALHAGGNLHRDIKPSNVLVTPEGRVVLLDFGVAIEQGRDRQEDADAAPVIGTPAYMAPEQVVGGELTPASDWYAVGALFFEALVGSAPFVGAAPDIMRTKVSEEPPRASDRAARIPPELDALCASLLQREPDLRPSGEEILRLVGPSMASGIPARPRRTSQSGAPIKLLGRAEHLRALREAFEATQKGRSITMSVRGSSGMGKSSLVRAFTSVITASSPDVLVLRGRAYERESVPYKAIDGWMDHLSRHLLRLSERQALPDLPNDVGALARIFPVLRRVPAIADRPTPVVGDPHLARRQGFAALRELLGSLAKRQPVVVHMDDAHWGDSDSAALLLEIVRPPQAPPLLIIMSYREDEAQGSPLFAELRSQWPREAEVRELEVGPLGVEDAANVALVLLDPQEDAAAVRATAEAVARESRGSPFLIEELARAVRDRDDPGGAGGQFPVTLERAVAERVARLPDDARTLLEVIAVGGRPLPAKSFFEAAGIADGNDALQRLRAGRFVRAGLRDGREIAETVNDRIRDAIVSGISGDRVREHSVRLALALEAAPDADVEAVAIQLAGAGEAERAVPYAERGAERAIAKFAFDRAVQLLELACEGVPAESAERQRLRGRLAEALAWAGRGAAAAREYLALAEREPGARRVELERAAAEQLLASGRIDEGAQVLHRVLTAIGMRAPDSTLALLFWLVVYQVRLAVMGVRFAPRSAAEVRPGDRARIEAMYAVAMGFAVVDVLLGACMQARFLLLSMRVGDSEQIMRAAALEAAQLASSGGSQGRRERALIDVARRLAAESGSVEAEAFVEGTRGVALFLRGRWKEARVALDESNGKLPASRNHWHTNAVLFSVRSLYFSGEIRELARRQARIVADARDRGDLYTAVNLAATTTMTIHLAADDPEGARREAHDGMAQWSQTGFLVQHFQAMAFEPDIDLYLGDGPAAYERLMRDRRALKQSLLLRVQFIRGIFHYTRGRCAIAAAGVQPERKDALIAEARTAQRRLENERMPWTSALAAIVRAGVENATGARAATIAALREAIEASEGAGMAMHAEAARFRLGGRLGGSEGSALQQAAVEAIAAEGVRDVPRWVAIYFPGAWPGSGGEGASQGADARARPVTVT